MISPYHRILHCGDYAEALSGLSRERDYEFVSWATKRFNHSADLSLSEDSARLVGRSIRYDVSWGLVKSDIVCGEESSDEAVPLSCARLCLSKLDQVFMVLGECVFKFFRWFAVEDALLCESKKLGSFHACDLFEAFKSSAVACLRFVSIKMGEPTLDWIQAFGHFFLRRITTRLAPTTTPAPIAAKPSASLLFMLYSSLNGKWRVCART